MLRVFPTLLFRSVIYTATPIVAILRENPLITATEPTDVGMTGDMLFLDAINVLRRELVIVITVLSAVPLSIRNQTVLKNT